MHVSCTPFLSLLLFFFSLSLLNWQCSAHLLKAVGHERRRLEAAVPLSPEAASALHRYYFPGNGTYGPDHYIHPNPRKRNLAIVYVFTVVPAVCKYGLPSYIKQALEQAVISQPDCDVIMASNYVDCPKIAEIVDTVKGVIRVDTALIESNRTVDFRMLANNIFQSDGGSELWLTSAFRFFSLEDMMIELGYQEMIHVEADNLLYGRMSSLLSIFRSKYKGLAATPLNANKSFITASVLWISSFAAIRKFNDFLLDLGGNRDLRWQRYLEWLWPYGCCKPGGVASNKAGVGIKPFSINEMSMLAYYHELAPEEFKIFPVVPDHNYIRTRYICNISAYGPHGHEIPAPTGEGIWDPNSWGQYIGGTSRKRGRDIGFTDNSHIAGQAIRVANCLPAMLCANKTLSDTFAPTGNDTARCWTAPFVRCGEDSRWLLLWNLHVHSKNTARFISTPCICNGA